MLNKISLQSQIDNFLQGKKSCEILHESTYDTIGERIGR